MAKKKYYQGKKDRMDESRGMKKAMSKGDSAWDFSDDRSQPACMPQKVFMRSYNLVGAQMPSDLLFDTDSMRGIDKQIKADSDSKSIKRGRFPEKF